MHITKPIIFVGMMGTGKTTIGRALAARLDVPFYDSDAIIESGTGLRISEIFSTQGEAAFRAIERDTILSLLENSMPVVISTGGGSVTTPDLLAAMEQRALMICLTAPVDVLVERVGAADDRPLLSGTNTRDTIAARLEARANLYARAHITVDTSLKDVDALVDHLVHLISLYSFQKSDQPKPQTP